MKAIPYEGITYSASTGGRDLVLPPLNMPVSVASPWEALLFSEEWMGRRVGEVKQRIGAGEGERTVVGM